MLIHIQGVAYDTHEALRHPKLNDLFELKLKTRSEEFPEGVSIVKLREYLIKLNKVTNTSDLVEDPETMLGLKSMMFLVRRRAGEKITVEEAGDVGIDEIRFEIEESDRVMLAEQNAKRRPFRRGRRASAPAGA